MITMMYVVGTLARDLGYITVNDLRESCYDASLRYTSEQLGPRAFSDGVMHPPNTGIEQCYYLAYVRKYVINHNGMINSSFIVNDLIRGRCAPAWNDTTGYAPTPSAYLFGPPVIAKDCLLLLS